MRRPTLGLTLRCPRCATAGHSDATTRAHTCAGCGALLLLAWSSREAFFVQDPLVADERQLSEALARGHPRGTPPRLLEARRFLAPIWHVWADIVQAAPGHARDGLRALHLRGARVGELVPAHASGLPATRPGLSDPAGWPCARPLLPADVRVLGPFLPWEAPPERARQRLEQAAAQPLGPELLSAERFAALVRVRRALVYRPRWLARVIGATGQGYVLVDGLDGALLGRPGTLAARALLGALCDDPQAFTGDEGPLAVRAASCPECGVGQAFHPHAYAQVCDACGRGLTLESTLVRQLPYAHAFWERADPDGLWLPFWTFRLRLKPPAGEPAETLEAWSRLAFPDGAPEGFEPKGELLYVPAFALLEHAHGLALFRELLTSLHARLPALEAGGLLPGGAAELVPATLPAKDARELGSLALLCVLSGAALARLGPSALRRAVLAANLTLDRARLTWVGFERRGDDAGLPGAGLTLPRACLRPAPFDA